MHIILKLIWRDLIKHPTLVLFTLGAITAAACLATWFVATIDLQEFADDNGTKDYYGTYSLALCSDRGHIGEDLIATVNAIPGVEQTALALQTPATLRLLNFDGATVPMGRGDPATPDLMGLPDQEPMFPITRGRWFQNPGECVIGTAAADYFLRRGKHMVRLPSAIQSPLTDTYGKDFDRTIKPGDEIGIIDDHDGSMKTLKVVGLFDQKFLDNLNHQSTPGMFSYYGFGVGLGGKLPKKAMRNQPEQRHGNRTKAQTAKDGAPRPAPPKRPHTYARGPHRPSPLTPSVYLSLADAARLSERQPQEGNILFVRLAQPTQADRFYQTLERELDHSLTDSGLRPMDPVVRAEDTRRMLSRGQTPASLIGQAWSTIGMVILASVFIIFTTLSLGVTAKTRQLAMLRTVGFTTTQIAAMILLEGLFLGFLGWLGGVFSGWLLMTITLYLQTGVIPLVTLSPIALLFALACSILGALAAAIVPAWKASRIAPADAMPRRFQRFTRRQVIAALGISLGLLTLIPLFVYCPGLDLTLRFAVFSLLGTLAFGTAFLCLIPAAATATEKLLTPAIACLLKLNPRFLKQLLTGNQWRTMGTILSLSIGLGLFTAVYIWGFSMMSMFEISPDVPQYIMRFHEDAISPTTTNFVRHLDGLQGPVMNVTVAQPELTPELTEQLKLCGNSYGNVVCMGFDGDVAWGENQMVKLKFTQGSPQEARNAFKQRDGRVILIPRTLAQNGNLKKGDRLKLKAQPVRFRPGNPDDTPKHDEQHHDYLEYQVVGVVEFPSLWYSKSSGTRVSFSGTSAVCFTPREALMRDFGAPQDEFFWFNGTFNNDVLTRQAWKAAAQGKQENFTRNPNRKHIRSFSQTTRWDFGLEKHLVILNSRQSMRNALLARSYRAIDRMAKIPTIILIISSIAVVNAIVVSIRSRTWEFGVMRACGLTQAALIRLVLAEAMLIGFCASVISFAFGLYYAWLTTSMVDLAPIWGVIAPPVIIPWTRLVPGYLFAILLSLGASLWPALAIGRKPLDDLLKRQNV